MRTLEQLFSLIARYGHPTLLGQTIMLNDWYLGDLSELQEVDEQGLIYRAIIASHEREQYNENHFGPRLRVTKEKIVALIKEVGIYSQEQGAIYLNGRKVGDIETLLQFSGMSAIIRRVAHLASGKPESEFVIYKIVTDEARFPQALRTLLSSLDSGR